MTELATIHMFWHGPPLTRIEKLCISSFVAHGHRVHLHVYEAPAGIPKGVRLVDAAETLPARSLFRHKGSGSLAPFADWFRYRLLAQQGGVWVDMDVVCLQPLTYGTTTLFGWMDGKTINNAVLGLPAGDPLAVWMAENCENPNRFLPYDNFRTRRRKLRRRLLQGNGRDNIKWGEYGPQGLTRAIEHMNYAHAALPFWHFYPIHYDNWHTVFDGTLPSNSSLISTSFALHLWNEMSRNAPGFNKNGPFPPHSLFETLCQRYLTIDS
jgi:hypothetical protein